MNDPDDFDLERGTPIECAEYALSIKGAARKHVEWDSCLDALLEDYKVLLGVASRLHGAALAARVLTNNQSECWAQLDDALKSVPPEIQKLLSGWVPDPSKADPIAAALTDAAQARIAEMKK